MSEGTYEHSGLKCLYCGYMDENTTEIFTDMEETIEDYSCPHCGEKFIASRTVLFTYEGNPN